jgi:hypothetical protein
MFKRMIMVLFCVVAAGCSTTGHFKVPPNSQLYVYERPEPMQVQADGSVTTTPFFWTASGIPPDSGIPYRLEQNGRTVQQGHLRAKFRVVSIFWPPLGALYWPMGFNPDITYDLVNNTQE